jgi:hypothetical protein
MAHELTFDEIIAIEPRLLSVLESAKKSKKVTWGKYERYKMRIFRLVGYGAAKKELRTCAAYETVIGKLVNSLKV